MTIKELLEASPSCDTIEIVVRKNGHGQWLQGYRIGKDVKGYLEEFCRKGTTEDDVPLFKATNVIEIAKDREEGIQDEFIPLWYEVESRRIKNETTETIRFNWTDEWMEEERKEKFMLPDELDP